MKKTQDSSKRNQSRKRPSWSVFFVDAGFTGLAVLSGLLLPWWGVALPALVRGLLNPWQVRTVAIHSGIATGMAWLLVALYQDILSGFRISARLASILRMPFGSGIFMHLLMFVIAGALGLLAALFGTQLSLLIRSLRASKQEG